MKKRYLSRLLLISLLGIGVYGCKNNQVSDSTSNKPSEESASPSESASEISEHTFSNPEFSKSSYSYDKNVGLELEMPLNLNGVNVYALYFNDYMLSAKDYSYDDTNKTLKIAEDFMCKITKGDYKLKVIFDEEVDAITLDINVMNSIATSFDTTTKKYNYGKTASLQYDCDFSTATIKSLMKGDVVLDSKYYSYSNNILTLNEELLKRCYGLTNFTLYLSNNDYYEFNVDSDIMFFTDYDITTIHSTIESIYGANPLYQYASSEHIDIIDGSEFGMEGNVFKYIPNYVDVELDCHGIFTLANTETSMSWYKVGYTLGNDYLISFDYQTVDSTDTKGQTFQFATVSNWGAPFVYSKNLLMGSENNNKVHHFSTVLSGSQISSGTIIFAKWIGGDGYLLIDNLRVSKIDNPFICSGISSYKEGTGDYHIPLNSNGWNYSICIDNEEISNATLSANEAIIPSSVMALYESGPHTLTIKTPLTDYEYELNIVSGGTASLSETSKVFNSVSSDIKLNGTFNNVNVTKALKIGSSTYDVSKTSDVELDKSLFSVSSDGLTISKDVLKDLYGTTQMKVSFTNGDTLTFNLTNSKVLFNDNFNESDVWCYDWQVAPSNCLLCQDTGMISFAYNDDRKYLVYQPKNASLGHSSTPGTYQNGFFTFRANQSYTNGTFWDTVNTIPSKNYKLTLNYSIEGDNENTKFIFYRWLHDAVDDKTLEIDPNETTWTYTFKGEDLWGFYFYTSYTTSSDVANYKVNVYSLTLEEVE